MKSLHLRGLKSVLTKGAQYSLKKSCLEIHGAILSTLMKAVEEQISEREHSNESERYRPNGHERKPRKLRSSRGMISYQFSQLMDRRENRTVAPLVEALSIPAFDRILEEATERPNGLTIHVSYRRAAQKVEQISGKSMSHTPPHLRLQRMARQHCPFVEKKSLFVL